MLVFNLYYCSRIAAGFWYKTLNARRKVF